VEWRKIELTFFNIDNFLDSGIMAYIRIASARVDPIRNRISRLTSRGGKCVRQRVAVVPTMLNSAHIEL
jgi:hypothetical protein